jgi:peptide chain release factor subunit 1
MKRFLREVTKTERSLAVYGENEIRKALEIGAVETLLLSENLRRYRVKIVCSTCDYAEWKTISEDDLKDFKKRNCQNVIVLTQMDIDRKDRSY